MATSILLVDDEADLTTITETYLRIKGFDVTSCNDPGRAIEVAQERRYGAFFVDLMMFPMDGITILRRLRELPDYAATPIFVVSSKMLTDEERKELLSLRVQFIPKPFHPRDLVNRLNQTLTSEQA